ncbi:MAG TPA: RDD family protein [Candidatus Thermoplasmatota archaeon]|nr:RDD family protein [Candidatus Thermoplasmatota archaeon]
MEAAVAAAPDLAPARRRYSWQREVPHTASTRRRAAAFAVDALVVFVLAWTFSFVAATANFLRIPDVDVLGQRSPVAGLLWVVSIFELPILLLYTTLFEGFGGRTPGKLLTGLRVARTDGAPATMGDAFLRNLLRLLWITPFGPAFVLLDWWSLRITELDQRMGDLAAGTVVVHERA